ncbi:MAG: head-tail adaptor protein [Ruminococcus sp.]|nr:head-tail adaptor protein [Ruminococcus sp.]
MINAGKYRNVITFQKNTDNPGNSKEWEDLITVYGYINGVSGNEFFIANAGYEAALTVTIECRYQPALMKIVPMMYRAACAGIVYELISPADDVGYRHETVKFRAKRIYTAGDGI